VLERVAVVDCFYGSGSGSRPRKSIQQALLTSRANKSKESKAKLLKMGSKAIATIAFLISLNLLFFTMVTSTYVLCPPPRPKTPKQPPTKPHPTPVPKPPATKPPATKPPATKPPATKPPAVKPPAAKPPAACPNDTLKLGVCANLLNDLVHLVIGTPAKTPCCSLIQGLADLEAAVCLCTAIKANILGINLNIPVSLSLLLNYCGKNVPTGFQCS